jgi:serine/threonine-protein phosphatase 5
MATADVEAATALKLKGNKAFAEHDWPRAIDYYTQAIEKNDKDASFFCNRAQAGLRRRWARDHLLIWTGEYQA